MKRKLPPIEILRQLVDYDPKTGTAVWKYRAREFFKSDSYQARWNARNAGQPAFAGNITGGYLRGKIFGIQYAAHRVIYALHHGKEPDGEIDHINHDRQDNRIGNLRVVSAIENMRNQKRFKNNKSGVVGVCWNSSKNKWLASIGTGGRLTFLGNYADKDEAIAVRTDAEKRFDYHPNHGRVV